MGDVSRYREVVERTIETYASWMRGGPPGVVREVVCDPRRDHYQLLAVGWDGRRRVHDTVLHLDIIDGKVWVQFDGTNRPVAEALADAGVPKEDIVLAEKPPEVRPLTGYGVG